MKPTKSKKLISQTAKELGVSEILVQDVVDFYYTTVRKKMESLNYPTLYLHHIGTLRLSRKKLQNSIDGLSRLLNSNEQDDFKKVVKYNLTREMLEQQLQAMENCNNHYNELNEKRNKSLESKRANPGRDKE